MSKGKVGKLFTKIKLPEKVKVGVGMAGLKIKKHSPEILLGLGFVSMGAAIISAVRSAREHDMLLADHEERLEAAKCEYVIPDEYDIEAEMLIAALRGKEIDVETEEIIEEEIIEEVEDLEELEEVVEEEITFIGSILNFIFGLING